MATGQDLAASRGHETIIILLLKPQASVTVTQGMVVVGVAGWPVTVGVASRPGPDAERYRCACLHCTQGLAGRGDGYQCGLDWGVLV